MTYFIQKSFSTYNRHFFNDKKEITPQFEMISKHPESSMQSWHKNKDNDF